MSAISKAISWKHLNAATNILPKFELPGQSIILMLLGYEPPYYFTMEHEVPLREAMMLYINGKISYDIFFDTATHCAKAIRNKEMKSHGLEPYSQKFYELYESFLPQYKLTIRNRISKFLGYEPNIEHSVAAELFLRKAMVSDKQYLPETISRLDMQAMTLINYRKVLFEQHKIAANSSKLATINHPIYTSIKILMDNFR